MSNHLTKIISVACLFLLSSSLCSQVIIRDSVTIAPRNTMLLPKGVVANLPVVDVSFVSSSESLFPGALIQIQMPDKRWTMIAAPCTGVDSALLQADMGIFPETGERIGEVLYSSCYGDMGGYLRYSDYFSPSYGESTGISVDLIGVGPNIRYLGYFNYLKPPLPTVGITTTPDSPDLGSLYISDNYQPTIEFTEEHTPNLGERFEPTIEWLTTRTINTGDYLEQVRSQGHVSIPIAVQATNVSGIATDTIWATLLGIDHFVLVPDSQNVDHGQSVYFSVQALDIYGNVIDNYYNPQSGDDYPYNIPLTITWDPGTLGEVQVPPQADIARRNNGLALNNSKKQAIHPSGHILLPKNITVKVQSDVASRKPITNFPKNESGKGQIHRIQSSLDTTISSLNCTYWDARYLQFVADGQSPDKPTPVTITVTSADGYNRTGIGHVVVNPVLPCGTVILSSDHMNPGDTIDVTIKIKIDDTTFADYPQGTLFNIGITDDGDYGLLLADGMAAPSFDDVTMPIKFIAADSIDVDSTIILFRGSPEKGSSVSGIAGKSGNKLMLTQAYKPKKGGKKFLAVADNSTCSGPTPATIAKQVPTSFSFTTKPNTNIVTHSNPLNLIVKIFDKKGNLIRPENCNSTINFIAGDPQAHEGEGFAQLNDNGKVEGINLPSVSYSDAYNGLVSYVADVNNYLGIFPLRITLSASVVLNGSPMSQSHVVTLMGDNTIGQYFALDDSRWTHEKYDHSDVDTIGNKGCFLGNVAMTLTAFGVNVDPKILNDAMNKDAAAWDGEKVAQAVLENYPGSTVKFNKVSEGLGINDVTDLPDPPDYSRMDNALASRFPVFAEVLNPDHNTVHWILVTGKTSTGDYTILDDGKHGRVTLLSSYGTIYKYYVTEHN